MDIVITIYVFFVLFGTVHAKDCWKTLIYSGGENATIPIGQVEITGNIALEINFSGYTSKQHVTNVMLYKPRKNQSDTISININYTDRIKRIEMRNSIFSFVLSNVNFMDSGNYTVFENSLEKGKTSILVARHRLLGQNSEPMIFSFISNRTNIAAIKIEMMISKLHFYVLKYDVTRNNCTEFGDLYLDRIERCQLRGNNFYFTIRNVSLLDMGMYVAWDDMNFLIDSIFVEFEVLGDNFTSSPEGTHTNFSSSFIPNILSFDTENYMLEWLLVSGVVVVLVAAGLVVNPKGRILQGQRQKDETITGVSIQLVLMMGPASTNIIQSEDYEEPHSRRIELTEYTEPIDIMIGSESNNTVQSESTDEKEYQEPHSSGIQSAGYIEPTGIGRQETETENGASCSHFYEKLHPYQNQGNNMYSSCRCEGTIDVYKQSAKSLRY